MNRVRGVVRSAAPVTFVALLLVIAGCGGSTSPSGGTSQIISFGAVNAQNVGATVTLSATASSGLPVTLSSETTSVCTVSATTATMIAAGTCTIQATQAGNAQYAAATPVSQSFTVAGQLQTITFAKPAAQTVGTSLTLLATASSGLTVSFASQTTSVCTVSGTTATLLEAGTCTVQATQGGNTQYAAAVPVSQSFMVNATALLSQTITFAHPGTQTVGAPLTLMATASSGLTVSFVSQTTSICTVSGTTATFFEAGACGIQATQVGNATYAAAAPISQSFTVNGQPQTITFAKPATQTVGTPLTLSASASSGLTVSFASQTMSVCTVSGTMASFVEAGTCTIQATQVGNAQYAAATPVSQSFTVNAAALLSQTITFTNPGMQTVGTPLTLIATASSGLMVSFASQTTSVCTVSGTTATFLEAGPCKVQATQAGNAAYAAATPVSQTFTVNATSGSDPTSGVLPSYNDAYANWKNAGLALIGGIPNRTTICVTVNPKGGGQDDFTDIQNAIDNCPAGEVVQLGAGAFNVKLNDLPIQIWTGITLRGTGACSGTSSPYCETSITVMDGLQPYQPNAPQCGTSTSDESSCPNGGPHILLMSPLVSGTSPNINYGPDYNYSWGTCGNAGATASNCATATLTADAAQGATTIQVSNTSSFSVGEWVLIDEASGASWQPDPMTSHLPSNTGYVNVWAASDWLSSSGSPATGRVAWAKYQDVANGAAPGDFGSGEYPYTAGSGGCWQSYCDRPTAELHKIASIGSGTLTFDDPLTIAFRQSGGHNAQVYGLSYGNSGNGPAISFLQTAGVENLSLLRGPNGGLEMEFCADCWVKNTEVGDWYGGGIAVEYSARSELNTDYIHHCWDSVNSGGEYPIALDNASTEILLTNSITNFGGKGMVARAGGAGSVVSYNYIDDQMYDDYSGIGDYWLDMSVNATHYVAPHHVLFEGNWGNNLDGDNTHGNSVYITFFRNLGTGLRTPFTDPSINKAVDDYTGVAYACSNGPSSCYLNTSGPLRAAGPSAYNYWYAFIGNVLGVSGTTTSANGWTYSGDFSGSRIFMLGWMANNGGHDPNIDGTTGSFITINGNYDFLNNKVTWTGSPLTLPNSFYLPGEPAFFTAGSGYSWPWVTPTNSSPVQSGPAGCGGTCSGLPAQARWQAGTPFVQP